MAGVFVNFQDVGASLRGDQIYVGTKPLCTASRRRLSAQSVIGSFEGKIN